MPPYETVNPSEAGKTSLAARSESTGKRHWWIWLIIFGVVALGWWYFRSRGAQANGAATGAPAGASGRGGAPGSMVVPVVVATAHKGDLPVYFNGLGTVTAFNTVTVRSRVDGQIVKVNFTEGQYVKEGDSLIEIDPRPYQVQLEQAEGQLAKDQAQLKDVQVDYERYQLLYKEGVIPKQQLDSQQAQVGQFEGAIKADQAQIDNAKLQIVYSHITAPISGRVGLRLVDVGNIVHATDTNGLLVITQLQPISVIFTLPQDQLPQVMTQMRGRTLSVEAWDRDNSDKIAAGKLLTIDNQIDTTTGTYKLKAVFDNSKNELFPNQFVNVHLLVDTKKNVILVPTTAILRGPKGTYVFAVGASNKVSVKTITLAETTGNVAGVASGLGDGDVVVIDGQDKLQDGSQVDPRQVRPGSSGGSTQSSFLPDGSTPGSPRGGPGR
ncbi:MAG TPA: MdtA/MuxA family multidrug efflux RND transporter periplasmic adaptor subunit [Methylomirabilota bacterium]|nr:MdtA/MuxA family multidrug efflux RND transporter periplasmic adaptor subunit [Methylomirabilota bacterium]